MKKSALILIILCLITVTGCTKKVQIVETDYTGVKVLRECKSPVETLNQQLYKKSNEREILDLLCGNMFVLLYEHDSNKVEFVPSHAKEMPTKSSDNKTWTFKLRDNITFSDGTVIDAHTYEDSYKLLLDPKLLSHRAGALIDGVPVKKAKEYFNGQAKWSDVGIKAIDATTLQITLEKEVLDTKFLMTFTTGRDTSPVHVDIFKSCFTGDDKQNNTYGSSVETMPSSGPYKLSKWIRGQYMKFEKVNEYVLSDYYKPEVVEYRLTYDQNTKVQLYESGIVDTLSVSGDVYNKYAEDPRLKTVHTSNNSMYCINKNSESKPYLGNIDFRKALYYSMPRQTIANDILKTFKPTYRIVAPNTYFSIKENIKYVDTKESKNIGIKSNGYDLEFAKECFNKAYAVYGKMDIEIIYYEGWSDSKRIVELLESQWESVFGEDKLNISIKMVPSNTIRTLLKEGRYDLAPTGWTYHPYDPFRIMEIYTSDFARRYSQFGNKEFDELYARCVYGDLVNDSQGRLKALAQLESMILNDFSVIPMYCYAKCNVFNNRIQLIEGIEDISVIGFGLLQADIKPFNE